MDELGDSIFEPVIQNKKMKRVPFIDLSSGYIQRGLTQFPKARTEGSWTLKHEYEHD